MAARKGFLDLPAELRNVIYEHVVRDGDFQHYYYYMSVEGPACTKKPGALVDRWNRVTHASFFNDEIFRSTSAIIATNHQIHAEFYAVLRKFSDEQADRVTFHVQDLDFQPLMDWFTSLPDAEKIRFKDNLQAILLGNDNSRSIQVALDFQNFTPVDQTNLKEWILFAKKFDIDLVGYNVVTLHPLRKEWIGHGPSYPEWLTSYRDFVKSSTEPMAVCYRDVAKADLGSEKPLYGSNPFGDVRRALQDTLREYERLEAVWWNLGEGGDDEDSDEDFNDVYSAPLDDQSGFDDDDSMDTM